jgi:uncharacterized protein (TIGR03435 family)
MGTSLMLSLPGAFATNYGGFKGSAVRWGWCLGWGVLDADGKVLANSEGPKATQSRRHGEPLRAQRRDPLNVCKPYLLKLETDLPAPLRVLIMRAYDVQTFQVSGPSWMDSQRFDVIAKVPDGATKEDAQIMLQNLLADRFKLKLRKGSKEAVIYELVVAKGGIKIKEAAQTAATPAESAGEPPLRAKDGFLRTPHGQLGIQAMVNGRMRMQGDAMIMARLTDILGMALGRPVVDKTGLRELTISGSTSLPKAWDPGPRVRHRERASAIQPKLRMTRTTRVPPSSRPFRSNSASSLNRARGRWIC